MNNWDKNMACGTLVKMQTPDPRNSNSAKPRMRSKSLHVNKLLRGLGTGHQVRYNLTLKNTGVPC